LEYTWAQYISFLGAAERLGRKDRLAFINDSITVTRADNKDYQTYREQLEDGLMERN